MIETSAKYVVFEGIVFAQDEGGRDGSQDFRPQRRNPDGRGSSGSGLAFFRARLGAQNGFEADGRKRGIVWRTSGVSSPISGA